MSNTDIAIKALSGLLSMGLNVAIASQQYTAILAKSRAEGREITDEELNSVQKQSQDELDEVSKLLVD